MKKYIRTKYGFILFSDHLMHDEILPPMTDCISAGFYHDGICFGESISLGIKSLPEDTEELKKWLG